MRATRRSCPGFTLLELLVAAGITALLAGFIIAIVGNVSRVWTRSSGRMSADAQARYVLDQLTLDLESACYRDDGRVWLAATVLANTGNSQGLWDVRGALPGALKPATAAGTALAYGHPELTSAVFGQAGTWLRFFTAKRGANSSLETVSAPVAVGWQIIRRSGTNPNSTDRRYFLHRAEVLPARTLEAGFDLSDDSPYAARTATGGNTGALGTPRSIRAPQNPGTIIGENVVDFGVRFHLRDASEPTGLRRVFPATNTMTTYAARAPANAPGTADAFPEVVDVMVRILTDEGARLIAAFEANPQRVTRPAAVPNDAQYWWQLALAHSRVYTRRIVLRTQAL